VALPLIHPMVAMHAAVVFLGRLGQYAFVMSVLRPHGTWVALPPIHPMVAMYVPSW
jgi:ABC-type maltose transport system permease subunit